MLFGSKSVRMGFLVLSILGSFIDSVSAQNAEQTRKLVEFRGYLSFGINRPDLGNLNKALNVQGFSEFPGNFGAVGGFGHVIIHNKFIIGGGGYGLARRSVVRGSVTATLSGGAGLFEVGYNFITKGPFKVYPMLGIGGGDLSLRITEKGSASFDEILENPRRGSLLAKSGVLLDLSVGVDYFVKTKSQPNGAGGLLFGARLGYAFAPGWGKWMMTDLDIPDGPKIGLDGPYLRFIFGGVRKIF